MTELIADVSSHNAVTSWAAFLASIDGLIAKVTQGTSYVWSGAQNALTQSRNADKLTGAYHFAGDLVGALTIPGDPVAEANYFLAHYTHVPGEPIVLDWEPTGFRGDPDAWGYAWCSQVIARTGVVPMLYLNHFYATQSSQWARTRSLGCSLWAAWYGANTGAPLPGMPSFAPWPGPAMWQYTSNGSRPGVSGVLDLNQFNGTADQWRAYGTPGGDMPLTKADADLLLNYPAYTGGPTISQVLKNLDVEEADVHTWLRGSDDNLDTLTVLYNLLKALQSGEDPQALAGDVVAAMGTEFAQKVIDALGQRINATQPAPPTA